MRSDYRAVVEAEVRIGHLARDKALGARLIVDRVGQLDVDRGVEVVAKEVRKNRIDREALKPRHAGDVMADERHPVRRMDDDHVGFELFDLFAAVVVSPAQHLPSAARARNVLRRIFAVHQVRRMGCDEATDNRSFTSHARRPPIGFAAAPRVSTPANAGSRESTPQPSHIETDLMIAANNGSLQRRRRNLGSVTSGVTSSNATSTGIPSASSLGLMSVTHETIRTPSSSSITAGA